jgi:diguanylate cyclase (GGDEF)-like protein/PAS domain S-box-containing protein
MSGSMMIVMGLLAVWLARSERNANEERYQANHQSVRSNRLLQEFEDHSPGWFWETDRQGNISYISPKVGKWFGSNASLTGQPLTAIALQADNGPVGERTLGFYLSSRTTFTELAVRAAVEGDERWWSVSGRPIIDSYGQFRGFIGTGTDLTEKRRSEAEVEKLARFDSLTGLANRAETSTLLNRALHSRPGGVRPTGLMMLDLDRFKAVNDTLGHPVGDELLKQVAARLCQVVGTIGQVGRLGGDEFKVVFPEFHDRRQLASLAEAMITSVSKPYFINSNPITIGASIGIATAPDDGTTSEELVRNADLALYAAKGAGRGVHRFYETTMHSVAEQKRMIENDMRQALAGGQFRMVYQPIVCMEKEKIIGFESLIRWNHPKRGPISPADFIPIAEENGMIELIGEWALRTATLEAANWAVDARVAVNVSTIQFANPKFPELVANVLAQSGLDPARLELEITESVFVADSAATDQQFALLKRLGIRLALDDFGTGYSSLGYLKRAPFDKIKIDQSFVRGASLGQDKNAAIIKAIVTLADTMNMETTAEGVETQDEIEFIRDLGCSHIQGFVYGKPLESADLIERLGTRGADAERIGHRKAREPRMRVFRNAMLDIHGRQHPVRIRNISNGGAMLEGPEWVTAGTPAAVDITDEVTVSGTISWVDEGRIGIKFDQRIDLSRVVAQVQAARSA